MIEENKEASWEEVAKREKQECLCTKRKEEEAKKEECEWKGCLP